jgi:hypothetical protein
VIWIISTDYPPHFATIHLQDSVRPLDEWKEVGAVVAYSKGQIRAFKGKNVMKPQNNQEQG